ncbi:MAG: hypothetical protein ABIF09_13300 [Gemmatimonadota bacterium]
MSTFPVPAANSRAFGGPITVNHPVLPVVQPPAPEQSVAVARHDLTSAISHVTGFGREQPHRGFIDPSLALV